MSKSFENIADLFSHADTQQGAVLLEGMVKRDETPGNTLYSPVGCEEWIPIPDSSILSAEYLYERACTKVGEDPHSHPYVRLMVSPTGENSSYLKVLSSFLISTRSSQTGRERTSAFISHSAASQAERGQRSWIGDRNHSAPSLHAPNLFGALLRKRGFTPQYNVDHCDYDTDICPGLGCVCVDYAKQHAWCCDCCVA